MKVYGKTQAMLVCLLMWLVMTGCQEPNLSPSPGLGDPYPAPMNDPQITIVSPELRQWLRFHAAIVMDDGERPMQVQVPVRNVTQKQYLIDYRFLFYDANGMELEPQMGWAMKALLPKQTTRLMGKALSTESVCYRLEMKWAR